VVVSAAAVVAAVVVTPDAVVTAPSSSLPQIVPSSNTNCPFCRVPVENIKS
jgi:hypothetical protein